MTGAVSHYLAGVLDWFGFPSLADRRELSSSSKLSLLQFQRISVPRISSCIWPADCVTRILRRLLAKGRTADEGSAIGRLASIGLQCLAKPRLGEKQRPGFKLCELPKSGKGLLMEI